MNSKKQQYVVIACIVFVVALMVGTSIDGVENGKSSIAKPVPVFSGEVKAVKQEDAKSVPGMVFVEKGQVEQNSGSKTERKGQKSGQTAETVLKGWEKTYSGAKDLYEFWLSDDSYSDALSEAYGEAKKALAECANDASCKEQVQALLGKIQKSVEGSKK